MTGPLSISKLRHAGPELSGVGVLDSVGNTPLLGFRRITAKLGHATVLAKAEWHNPGGSIKDRPARAMLLDGVRAGKLRTGKTIIDATSGNTGCGLAALGAAMGYRVKLALPRNASPERKAILRALAAELVLTDPTEGTDGAQRVVREIVAADPDRYFYPDQYNNPANWRAHYETTAEEIWRQTEGEVTHFVAALGTTGTFVGTTRRLRELNPNLVAVSVQPDGPLHGLEGVKHLATAQVPGIYDPTLADWTVEVDTEDAYRMVRRLAREEGLLVGPSGGANLFAAMRVARNAPPGSVVVTVFCDSAHRYLSDGFWEESDVLAGDPEVWP
jgi:S-sulfo-L-cysteine synthase (O-acetyl-L-serine-dependent)